MPALLAQSLERVLLLGFVARTDNRTEQRSSRIASSPKFVRTAKEGSKEGRSRPPETERQRAGRRYPPPPSTPDNRRNRRSSTDKARRLTPRRHPPPAHTPPLRDCRFVSRSTSIKRGNTRAILHDQFPIPPISVRISAEVCASGGVSCASPQ